MINFYDELMDLCVFLYIFIILFNDDSFLLFYDELMMSCFCVVLSMTS